MPRKVDIIIIAVVAGIVGVMADICHVLLHAANMQTTALHAACLSRLTACL